jgi:hypothetical protein
MKTHFYWVSRLNERYEAGLTPTTVENIDYWCRHNFVDNPEDLGIILNKIDAELNVVLTQNLLPK